MKGAEALIKTLELLGVEVIFGYPGGANLPIYDAFLKSNIHHVLARHEQGAALMADGYARVSGKVGVCLATSGPGVTNIITGLATSYLDSIAVLAITGQIPRNFVGTDAFQEVDCFNLSMHVTKHNELITEADEIVPALRAAYHICSTGRKGPVLVDFPKDILSEEIAQPNLEETRELPGYNPTLQGHVGQIKRAIKTLKRATRPLILSGGGVVLSQAENKLIEFAEMTNIPVVRTLMGNGTIGNDHPLFVGMIGTHGDHIGNQVINKADVILVLGSRLGDRSTLLKKDKFAQDAKKIHVDIDPAEIGKNVSTDIPIVGDIKIVLQQLIDELQKKPFDLAVDWFPKGKKKTMLAKKNEAPVMEIVLRELSKIDEPMYISTDVGRHQMWATHYCLNQKHLPLLTSGGLGTMGYGLPAAIGSWFWQKDRPVICITGDGSFYMNMQEFIVAVEYDIPLVVLVMNDHRLGMIRELQDSAYGSRYSSDNFKLNMNYQKFAESFGAYGVTVHSTAMIYPAIKEAISKKKPCIIEFSLKDIAKSELISETA